MAKPASTTSTHHPVAVALQAILDEVSGRFLERRAVVEAVLMAILAKEHFFILGPVGTGKSDMVREIFARFTGATYFEQLLSKNRPDAAVLGPYDMALIKLSQFKRKDTGFLTDVNFAFLDEIGKSSPTLGHDLLAAANERIKHEVNGSRSVHQIPLYTLGSGSNELIVQESEDAAALWDRLLVRTTVDYIQETGNFVTLMQDNNVGSAATTSRTTVDFADLADAIDNVVPAIDIPIGAVETIVKLRDELRAAEITVSDRRWRQCRKLVRASAFLHGRSQVEDDDLQVLKYALWDAPEDINRVERITLSLSNPVAEKCLKLLDDGESIAAGIRERKGKSIEERAGYGTEANGKLKVALQESEALRQECLAAGRSTTKVDEVTERLHAIRRSVYLECLDMDPSMIR